MKRASHLMPAIATAANLAAAFRLAAAGKRHHQSVQEFAARQDENLAELVRELASGAWQSGGYERFTVRDPKLRIIHAASFRDRVAHHALLRVAGPVLERGALPHSHACRAKLGNLAAVRHAVACCRRNRYFLKLDIRRYFDSIPHHTLLRLLRRRFKDGLLMELIERLIFSFHHTPGRGLPIGTLTSQFLANFYLDGFDRWVVENLRAPGYVRYMDDFVIWHDDANILTSWLNEIREWLLAERSLEIKSPARPLPCRCGVSFLGYRLSPQGIFLGKRARRRFSRRLREVEAAWGRGEITSQDLQRRTDALLAFTAVARCQSWRRGLLHPDHSLEPQAPTVSSAAAPGTTRRGTAAPLVGTGTTPASPGTTSACACPQLTRAAEVPRLTRSPELDGPSVRDDRPSGAGRDASRRQPNAPEGHPESKGPRRDTASSPNAVVSPPIPPSDDPCVKALPPDP